ncbi:unnamed protein product [Vitrella brassicaformis CCMP3155]|uniref:Uncharacterized protein n=1 Tax=Vitrella brassicaformis (strain CCMP3155) TaxID=1169540 RepID=A0A0G4EP69_VITBC|nr:unnamed protein product [Vitrella brassicaformis CCMP3155]|mmetsp:Transcript_17784/g.42741  ORF Transcript_17784/g.42741 Transcript_17784/m.42741 type:complete len:106 (-) Transcript_17784:1097-1414(-)|eukprot:CEL99419.1 unnamed protein product [Vitrella brassicaformis CCMP3155]
MTDTPHGRADAEKLDPRPLPGSPAWGNVDTTLANDPFFQNVNFTGAFGDDLWLLGWTWWDYRGKLPGTEARSFFAAPDTGSALMAHRSPLLVAAVCGVMFVGRFW